MTRTPGFSTGAVKPDGAGVLHAVTGVFSRHGVSIRAAEQEGLGDDANQWVNVQRLYDPAEGQDVTAETNGTTEWQMRNQFRAWSKFMTMSM